MNEKTARSVLIAGALIVLVWRAAALRLPSSMVEIPQGLAPVVTCLGLFFVLCGMAAYLKGPNRLTAVFALFCLGAGIHWGGPVGAASAGLERGILLLYLGLSVMSDTSILLLALWFPPSWRTPSGWIRLLYVPAALGVILAPAAGVLPNPALETVAAALLLIANLFSIAAAAVFVVRLLRSSRELRQATSISLVVAAIVVGGVPSLMADTLPGTAEYYHLLLAVIPAALAWVLAFRRHPTAPDLLKT